MVGKGRGERLTRPKDEVKATMTGFGLTGGLRQGPVFYASGIDSVLGSAGALTYTSLCTLRHNMKKTTSSPILIYRVVYLSVLALQCR